MKLTTWLTTLFCLTQVLVIDGAHIICTVCGAVTICTGG
jgi:hypothetical protein